MSSIASLVVDISANTASFVSDLSRTSKQSASFMKKMEREATASCRAIGVALTAVGVAATAMVAKTINAADKMRDLSIQTGISTETLSVLKHVADQSGVAFEGLTDGIGKMQKSLIAARDSTSETNSMFERMGLDVEALLKLSPAEQFAEIAEAISNLGNVAEQTAASQAIFGKSGVALLPVLKLGKEGFRELGDEVGRFGTAISADFASNADTFNDNIGKMKLIAEGVAIQFTSGLLPSLIAMQEELIQSGDAAKIARDAGELLGEMAGKLADTFKFLAENATLVEIALGGYLGLKILTPLLFGLGPAATIAATGIGLVIGALATFEGDAGRSEKRVESLTRAIAAMTDEWLEYASAADIIKEQAPIRAEWLKSDQELFKVEEQLANLRADTPDDLEKYHAGIKALVKQQQDLITAQAKAVERLAAGNAQLKELKGSASAAIAPVTALGAKIEDAAAFAKEWTNRQSAASKSIERNIRFVEDLEKAQADYSDQLRELNDIADPVAALMRTFGEQVAFANIALDKGDISIETYRQYLNQLSDQLGETAAGMQETAEKSSTMTEAMLEGVRIIERTFTDMWASILDGGENAFEGLLDGFKTLLANMVHQMFSGKIVEQLRNAIDPDKIVDWKALKEGIGGTIGVVVGSIVGGGGTGAAIGSMLGTAIGSIAGPIGAAIGGILGGLAGGLFDSNRPPLFEASGRSNAGLSGSDDDDFIDSAFGRTFIRSRRLDQAAINEFKSALEDFDNSISSFLDDSQISSISDVLKDWSKKIEDETLSAEELLNSRFAVILSTFTADIQNFVNQAQDLEEKAARLQIGVGVEKLFAEKPDLFGQHTVREFLAVVDAFKDGTESIADAFNEVLQLLDTIVTVKQSLREFADSDLAGDFNRLLQLQSEGVIQTLTRLTTGLADAITNFDGSPEQLVEIGNLALSVRQQELAALSLLDSVAKGLHANLDRLQADVNTTINGPRAAEEILFDARALIGAVSQAQTPEELARIGQEFEALIRSLSPEDTKAFGTTINALIDSFRATTGETESRIHQAILDSGQDIRDMADNFEAMIDPIQVIADTNERAALALESIANGTAAVTVMPVQDIALADPVGQTAVISQGINEALTAGVDEMAIALAKALREGLLGVQIVNNVVVQDQGLVTQ